MEPYKWQSIITKCDYESPNLFKEILREIGNLTEINEKVVLSESPAFLMYSARCGCQQCKEHDRLYNQSRGIPPNKQNQFGPRNTFQYNRASGPAIRPQFGNRPNMQMYQGPRPFMQNRAQFPNGHLPQRFAGSNQMIRPQMNRTYYIDGQSDPNSMYNMAQYNIDNTTDHNDLSDTICVVSTSLNPEIDIFVAGIMDVIIVDSGCKRNVCSTKMIDRIKPYAVNEFKLKPTNCMFRFGGNVSKPALGEVDICLVYLDRGR